MKNLNTTPTVKALLPIDTVISLQHVSMLDTVNDGSLSPQRGGGGGGRDTMGLNTRCDLVNLRHVWTRK